MFERIEKIINKEDFNKIQNLNILIVGIGGVGGYALEGLIRSGVKNITIIDNDVIDITNLNRQIIALNTNIGSNKVDIAKERCLNINFKANIKTFQTFLDKSNINNYINEKFTYDYIIDACDTVTTKLEIIRKAEELNIPIISCMGTGNRFDPTKIHISKLSKTNNDPLAKVMRKLVKEERLKDPIVLWSSEIPIKTHDRNPGSMVFVPACAGMTIASYIIK